MIAEEFALELARLERAVHERARKLDAERQTDTRAWLAGEAGVEPSDPGSAVFDDSLSKERCTS